MGQIAPLTTRADHIKERIQHLTQVKATFAAPARLFGQCQVNGLPFGISQVTWIRLASHTALAYTLNIATLRESIPVFFRISKQALTLDTNR